ncbi:hypothetical protein [Fluviicola sp.]|uniref:hypothetical protein n=1 Tax=Fluviicola sp. TaxID=1917219 RepID=UPI0031D18B06
MNWKIVIGACALGFFLVTSCASKESHREVKFVVDKTDETTQLTVQETKDGVTTTKAYSGKEANNKIKEYLNDADEAIKQAAKDAEEKLEKAGEEIEKAAKKTGDKIEEGVDKAGEKVKEAWDDTKEGVKKANEKVNK